MQKSSDIRRYVLCAMVVGGGVGCGSFGDDSEQYSDLKRLRVLAIRSEPADLVIGETATLDAFVFEPDGRELKYEWSWCPSRADADGEFECDISEKDLEAVWKDLGIAGSAPSYNLGTESKAEFTHVLSPELVAAACASIGGKENASEQLILACQRGIQPSVQLKVRTTKAEVVAVKNLTLLSRETPAAERNQNPVSDFGIRVRRFEDGREVSAGKSLVAGGRYVIDARFDEDNAQSFTSVVMGQDTESEPPEEKKEQLVMSWFFTVGEGASAEEEDGFGPEDRTTFVPGASDFGAFLRNGWQLPLTAEGEAKVVLVVRDERGGVGWSEQRFDVEGK